MQEFTVTDNDAGQRFDKYLFKLLSQADRGLLYKQLRCKNILLNGKKAKGNEILKRFDSVKIFMADETIEKFSDARGRFLQEPELSDQCWKVVYEDRDLLAVDKPAGILSQKAAPSDVSMNEYLRAYLGGDGSTFTPSFCNRLDRNTSGLLLAGKTLNGTQQLSRMLRERSLQKYYLAVVVGHVKEAGLLDGCLKKEAATNQVTVVSDSADKKNRILTGYEPVAYHAGKNLTLLKVHLITGKTHQIRAHLASVFHPILGDAKYGVVSVNRKFHAKRQLLHAYEAVFPDGRVIRTPFPDDFIPFFNENDVCKGEKNG